MNAHNDKSLDELQQLLYEAMDSRADLIAMLKYIPLYRLSKILRALVRVQQILGKLPAPVWRALYEFLRCNSDFVKGFNPTVLLQMVRAMIVLTELQIEASEDDKDIERLKLALSKMQAAEQRLAQLVDKGEAFNVITELKVFLKANYADLFKLLQEAYSEKAADAATNALKHALPGIAIKGLIKMVAKHILTKKLGAEMAKRLMPAVGIALTLAEFTAIVAMLQSIQSLDKLIDALYVAIITKLIDGNRLHWPSAKEIIWIKDKPEYQNANVVMRPYVHCFDLIGNEWVMRKDSCLAKFFLSDKIEVVLNPNHVKSPHYNNDLKRWEIGYAIDDDSVDNRACLQGAELCITLVNVQMTNCQKPENLSILVGAKKMR